MPINGPELERPVTLANVLEAGLRARPDDAALILLDRTWTWRELETASTRLARHYVAMGLAAGDGVASL